MKNIKIAYLLSFLWRSWFWLGIWVFYYLKFTDYAGIGFLEAVMITTSSIGEIPTGAIADVLGKKQAVIIAFLLGAIGNIVMAFTPNYPVLITSIIIMTLGGYFYSGSLEALVYDTLKQKGKENEFEKVISRMNSMTNLGMAIAGITGGFLYNFNNSLPFLGVALFYLIGVIASLWLVEPRIDTEKYSWKEFVNQNRQGFKQLFGNIDTRRWVLLLLITSSFMVATENVLNDAAAVELGFTSVQLGIFATILYLSGIVISELSAKYLSKTGSKLIFGTLIIGYVATLIIIPRTGLITGAILLLIRYGCQTVFGNWESIRINRIIESRYRATTLSTYSLIRNIPYILAATGIGVMMNLVTARVFSVYFGLTLLGILMIYVGITRPWNRLRIVR